MRVAVLGSAGFVGSHMVQHLYERGFGVLRIDKKDGHDIVDNPEWAIDALVGAEVDWLVHLAADPSTARGLAKPHHMFADTIAAAITAVEICRDLKIRCHLTSTVKARPAPYGRTPYGTAKFCAEEIVAEYGATYGLPYVINRPGTIYGPGQEGSEESGWVAWFCRARDEGLPVTIHGDGTQTRDLLHVTDYCELVARQIAEPDPYFARRWDVGGGKHNAVSVLGLAQWLGLDYTFGPSRPGDAPSYIGYNDVPDWEPTVRWWESETLACMTNSPLLPS